MKLYATTTSERASKGQGGEYLDIVITGAHQTELITLKIVPDGNSYRLTGWTHDDKYISLNINENMAKKGEKKKGEKICEECKTIHYEKGMLCRDCINKLS